MLAPVITYEPVAEAMTSKRYTDENIIKAVADSTSVRQVMIKIGMKLAGGSHTHISRRIRNLNIDTSHFTGQYAGLRPGGYNRKSWEEYLILRESGGRQHGDVLTKALLASGEDYSCSICGISAWNWLSITLEVDHINRNWLDDRKENLRLLCPNCHSQVTKGVYPNLVEEQPLEGCQ